LLYLLGVGRGQLVKAQFELADGPILILVDDPAERIDWPPAGRHIFNELGQTLIDTRSAKKIVPFDTLEQIRRSEPEFEKRGCREIGHRAGAEQVLWLEVQDFLAEEQIYDPANAAFLAVAVKVIDAGEENSRARVRLWPTSPEGHLVTVNLGGTDVSAAKTKDGISKKLAEVLAGKVAELFHDHRLGDFERPP